MGKLLVNTQYFSYNVLSNKQTFVKYCKMLLMDDIFGHILFLHTEKDDGMQLQWILKGFTFIQFEQVSTVASVNTNCSYMFIKRGYLFRNVP